MLKTGGCDPPDAALRPPQSGGEPLVRPARGPVFVLLRTEGSGAGSHGQGGTVMKRLSVLPAAVALTLLLWAGAAYGASPPSLSRDVDEQPSGTAWALLTELPSWPLLIGASATAGAGVVQGHVYDYDGDPVAGVEVGIMVLDDQDSLLWSLCAPPRPRLAPCVWCGSQVRHLTQTRRVPSPCYPTRLPLLLPTPA